MLLDLENAELEVIESKVKLDIGQRKVIVEYPFTTDPSVLGNSEINNRGQAIGMQKSVERRIRKKGLIEAYNTEFDKFIQRGTISPVSPQELSDWQGPVHYVSHHEVLKPSSPTTPCRIVTNSALVNRTCGKSLNQILMKGPNCLNSLVEVLLRFRRHETALIYDLSKAYNSLYTGPLEKFTRLIVWRNCEEDADWTTYGYNCVAFGDHPAAAQLECAKTKCAEAGTQIDLQASEKIRSDTYVDDGVTGGSPRDVVRLRGGRGPDGSYDGTIPTILGLGGLAVKAMMVSGEGDLDAMEKLGDQVLGIKYSIESDMLLFPLMVHIHPKRRGVRVGEPLTAANVHLVETVKFTPRLLTGLVNSFYDPLGLMAPWLVKFKLLLKRVSEQSDGDNSWDTVISAELAEEWKTLIKETVALETVSIPRSFRPDSPSGPPTYVGFWDGSLMAWSCAIYARWDLTSGLSTTRLIAAKVRVTPKRGTSVPKAEVGGLLDLSRLMMTVARSSSEHPKSVVLIGDSECCISMMEKSGSSLAPFFCNRIGEIKSNLSIVEETCPVEPLHHVRGDLNPSDLPTRGFARAEDLPGSVWRDGPQFLRLSREQWPISRDFVQELPSEVHRISQPLLNINAVSLRSLGLSCKQLLLIILTLDYSDCIDKITAIVARLIVGWTESVAHARRDLSNSVLRKAARMIIFLSQTCLRKDAQRKKLKSLNPHYSKMVSWSPVDDWEKAWRLSWGRVASQYSPPPHAWPPY